MSPGQRGLCWLHCPTSSRMHVHTQELSDWRTTYVIRMKINFGSFATDLQSLNALCTAVYQRTQSTSKHNDRFHPCDAPCLRIFSHIYLRLLFNQVLSISDVLNISGSPNYLT